jgi:hypothetical protein
MFSCLRKFFEIATCLCGLTISVCAGTATTYIYLNSQPGDYVGGGITQTLTTADGTFSLQNPMSGVTVIFEGSQFWELTIV